MLKVENSFDHAVAGSIGDHLYAKSIETFQVNVTLKCNLACLHCHVLSSPRRTEMMQWETMQMVLDAMAKTDATLLDITGGAPEMNPHFKPFIAEARRRGYRVQVRTNLTVLLEEGYESFPQFFRDHQVELVASMPCYLEENVDKQRGSGVYDGSIQALQRLNQHGYGIEPHLPLNLIYNPIGPSLPPSQEALEQDYKRELRNRFNIEFTSLLVLTNMPIGRFQTDLHRQNRGDQYLQLLKDNFNPKTVDNLMCRNQVNVDWDGNLYDCDFNLALKMPMNHGVPNHISQFDRYLLEKRQINTGEHCFGCTAGCGSSCSGALA